MEHEGKQAKTYDAGIDLVRVVAMVMAFILHFYWENGFYYQPLTSAAMYFHTTLRELCFCCVPLFMMLTGYLKCGQEPRKGYYASLKPILICWFLLSALSGVYQYFTTGSPADLYAFITGITQFQTASYSWYVNMYIGMLLVSPYINLCWNKLKTKENHQKMLLTALLVACVPATVNAVIPLLPSYFIILWPFAYYLLGCYIRTWDLKLPAGRGLLAAVGIAFGFTVLIAITGGKSYMAAGRVPSYGGLPQMGLCAVVFCSLRNVKRVSPKARETLRRFAPLALPMIIISEVFNKLLFQGSYLALTPENYLSEGLWRVPLSLFLSWCVAWPVNRLSQRLAAIPPFRLWSATARRRTWRALAWGGLAGSFLLILWKCSRGFCNNDEAFYLSIPIRLCQGAALLAEEWHVSQLSAVLLYPFMLIYRWLFPGMESIVLHFRWLYAGVQLAVSLFLYTRWKRLSRHGALPAALIFLLFAPFGLGALSYNSMGVICVALAATLPLTAKKRVPLQQILGGVCLAGAVLCCPSLAAAYLVYALIVALRAALKKKADKNSLLSAPGFLRVTLGCALLAVPVIALILSRASVSKILESLPWIFSDPEHSMANQLMAICPSIQFMLFPSDQAGGLSAVYFALLLICAIDKGRARRRWAYWAFGCVVLLGQLVFSLQTNQYINAVTLSLSLLPPLGMLLMGRDRCVRRVFLGLWLPGMAHSLCLLLVSTQSYLAAETGMVLSCAAGAIIAVKVTKAILRERTDRWWEPLRRFLTLFSCVLLLGWTLASEAWLRYDKVFWEDGVSDQTCLIQYGPEKGLYATDAKKTYYDNIRLDMEKISAREPQARSAALLTGGCWYYLFTDWDWNVYSVWLSAYSGTLRERLSAYYEINPDKLPDLVLIDKTMNLDLQSFWEQAGYTPAEDSPYFSILYR